MNLNEFCEQILLETSLQKKLMLVEDIDFNCKAYNMPLPDMPARSDELAFNQQKPVALPSLKELESERHRGILLHFFLNHELLALELMALMLLRFPDAPQSFKKGLVNTMQDEQRHAQKYLGLMKDFGVQAGDVPVNKFFWQTLSTSDNLQKFVAGMSLTFEQANLDFSLFYKNAFETIGDKKTSTVLQDVYDDEVSHVRHGLGWFRRWKKSTVSDWQEYANILEIPLSPSRGKGPLFDLVGRQKAGFDEDFIANMKVTSMSRGRSPDIFIFHGFTEVSISIGTSFNIPKWGRQLEEEMSLLPIVFCKKDDLLYTWKDVSVQHLQKLQECGLTIPEVATADFDNPVEALEKRHPGSLNPWGWSPFIDKTMKSLIEQSKGDECWRSEYESLFSKSYAVTLFEKFADEELENENLYRSSVCRNLREIKSTLSKITRSGWSTSVVKSPLGASGRNMFRVMDSKLTEVQESQIQNLLADQKELIVEPWVERVLDFSLHFDLYDKAKFVGTTRLINDERGQYMGSVVGSPWKGLDSETLKKLHAGGGLNSFAKKFGVWLTKNLRETSYVGPVGIDCFIYRDLNGELQFKPLVEMNFRYTMGRVALGFEKHLSTGKVGLLNILSLKSKRQAHLREVIKSISTSIPEKGENGLWNRGVLLVNEYSEKLVFPIVVTVGESVDDCESQLGTS
ncbi:MAG: ferritin-like domain-containing protein [Lentisphaeraceae bacterium]|nr:ferritin-like domain-containing protein [Lentisphaeraceae bacterium]